MNSLFWVVLLFLTVVGVIDWKVRKIPSIFLTGMLFVVAYISIYLNPLALPLGVLGFILGYMLYEADFFGGVADIKVFTMISLMLLDFYSLIVYVIVVLVFGITWKAIIRIRLHKKKNEDFAFLPVFIFVYLAMWLIGGII